MDLHHRKYNTLTGLENFILRLKENNPDLEYYSGYKTSEDKVQLKCCKCGTIFERNASCVRKPSKIRCYQCEKNTTTKKKRIERTQNDFLKDSIKFLNGFTENISLSICEECGNIFVGSTKYCSEKCRRRLNDKKKEFRRRTRKNNNGESDYTISLTKLIKRDNNICYLCGKECNLNDYTYKGNTFVSGNYYPSIDHIIPLSKGGTHTWNNVKLAHRICNSLKRDNL